MSHKNSAIALSLLFFVLTACQQMVSGGPGGDGDSDDNNPPPPPPPPPAVVESSAQMRLGDRYFVESVFKNIFGSGAQVVSATNSLVQTQLADFGAGCDKFGPTTDFCNGQYQNSLLPSVTPVTSIREALRLRACYFVLSRKTEFGEQDRPLREAVAKAKGVDVSLINLDGVSFPSALEIRNAFQLFFPEVEPSEELIAKLTAVAQANVGYGVREPWRFVFITICSSPAWQAP